MSHLYRAIQPISIFMKASVLYRDEANKHLVPGQILGVFSYPGHAPSFKVLLNNEAIWDFCLPNHIYWTEPSIFSTLDLKYDLVDLAYENCPSKTFDIYVEPTLALSEIDVYFKNKLSWQYRNKYLLTVDWYRDNKCLNLIQLSNGQLAFVANHKMLIRKPGANQPVALPAYRALKEEGKV